MCKYSKFVELEQYNTLNNFIKKIFTLQLTKKIFFSM